MKKIIGLFCVILSTFSLFAWESQEKRQVYFTGAYNFALFTERADSAQTELISNGMDLSVAGYFNQSNWGLYLNTDYNFPCKTTVTSGGSSISATSSDWDFSMLASVIFGPTYKHSLTEKFELFLAGGLHFAQYSVFFKNGSGLNYSFGIGGDIGFRYFPSERFYLTFGTLLSHDFFYVSDMAISGYGRYGDSGAYNFGSFRPYIGIGIKYLQSSSVTF